MSEIFNYCHIAELTDKGCKRSENEDWMAHFESPNGLVAVVCDGMGGHVGGKTASHTAVEAIQKFMMQERGCTPFELIVEALNVANAAILNKAAVQPELTGMGSTCVMLIVRDGKVYIGSVGDSRVYLIRNRKIKQLTKDQSYVQMLVDSGSLTPEQAEHHPRKNEITNALGLKGMQPATVLPEAINPEAGDCYLLCSDGLSGMVPDDEICKVVSRQVDKTQTERVEELILRAKRNGGVDNITCQIVEFSVSPNTKDNRSWWKKNMWAICGTLAAVVFFIAASIWYFHDREEVVETGQHSETVTQLISTVDSVFTLESVKYSEGGVFMEIIEDKDFGGIKIHEKHSSGETTMVIKRPFSIKKMEVLPIECINVEYFNVDSTRCVLSFKKDPGKEKEIAITFHGDKDFLYIVPLLKPESNKTKDASEEAEPKKTGNFQEKEYEIPERPDNTFNRNIHKKTNTDCEIIINSNEPDQTITLWSKQGRNTKKDLYFPDYAFTNTGKHYNGWYSIEENNGQKCVIVITNTRQNPIPSENAVIKIPTRPECNNGEGIILRIKKLDEV